MYYFQNLIVFISEKTVTVAKMQLATCREYMLKVKLIFNLSRDCNVL